MATKETITNTAFIENAGANLGACYDAFDAIEGIARAIATGSCDDYVSLAKGIRHIAGDMASFVDSVREEMKHQ